MLGVVGLRIGWVTPRRFQGLVYGVEGALGWISIGLCLLGFCKVSGL